MSRNRWLLPDAARSAVVMFSTACAGAVVLAWIDGYITIDLLIVLAGAPLIPILLALVPRRQPPTARTVAAVLAVNEPPFERIVGRCRMVLRINDVNGVPRQFVHVDPRTPTAIWPTEGTRVIVEVTGTRRPRVAVLWHLGVVYPEPPEVDESGAPVSSGATDEDLLALPKLEMVEAVRVWEPSRLVRPYLVPTERFQGEWRRHWVRWFKDFAFGFLIALLIGSGYQVGVGRFVVDLSRIPSAEYVAAGFWGVWVLWRGLTWLNNRLVLTSKRVMLIKGVLWRRVASVPVSKATEILHTKSPLGALLGYGVFRLLNVPILHPLWRISDLPRANDLYLRVIGETFEPEPEVRRAAEPVEAEADLDDFFAAPQPAGG